MSFNRAQKSVSREHRERGQLADRKHLGLLEKKKDWIQRARAHQKKSNKLKKLRTRALERNHDEFDFHMLRSQVGYDGVHREADDLEPEDNFVQKLLSDITDINYVRHKLTLERKKIDKLKAVLHLTDSDAAPNSHVFFVDDEEEVAHFDPTTKFGTTEAALGRRSNRITADTLKSTSIPVADKAAALEAEKERHAMYEELDKRIRREKELNVALQKLELKKQVITSKGNKPKKVEKATEDKPACFRWKFERKR